MKAIFCTKYGPPEVLVLKEIDQPVPKPKEILVKNHAAAVTSADSRIRGLRVPTGFKLIMRLVFGFNKPKRPILGMEIAGEVEAVGSEVKSFKKGDPVFGNTGLGGAYAEYVCVAENKPIVKKPSAFTYEEAAAIPFGALTSLRFLRDFGKIKKGQKVLVNGASGNLGTFGIQLAKYYGAEVTGICSGANFDLVKSLGADKLIDYTKEDFTDSTEIYDIIYDTIGNLSFSTCKNNLKSKGRLLLAVASLPQMLKGAFISIFSSKKIISGDAAFKQQDLIFLTELFEKRILRPVIDRTYPLEEIVEAHRYVDKGHKKGSVVITFGAS